MIPCPACDRFVRTESHHCPFCDAVLRDGSMLGAVVVGALLGLGMTGCVDPGDGGTESESMESYEAEVAAYAGPEWTSSTGVPPGPSEESGTTSVDSADTTAATDTGTSTMTATETGSETATESGSETSSGSDSGTMGSSGSTGG